MIETGKRHGAARALPTIGDASGDTPGRQDLDRARAAGGGGTALIADDDEYFRMALGVILTDQLGFSDVIETASFDDAVDRLVSDGGVSLALFDLAMPGMASAASLRTVRESFADLKIVVISGSRRRHDVLTALSSGVHGYVPKSAGAARIRSALELVLGGSVYVPPLIAELDDGPAGAVQGTLETLTPRQREVLRLLVQGRSNKEIARILDLGEGTVKVHVSALFRSLGTNSRTAAAAMGAQILGR